MTGAKTADVEAALATALTFGADASAQITTLTQLERLSPGNRALEVLRPRPFHHYTGHMIAAAGATQGSILAMHKNALSDRIAAALDRIDSSAVFGSLASGADILIVEHALARSAQAQIFLPFDDADFHRASVAPAGGNWVLRARACMDHKNAAVIRMTNGGMIPDQGEAFAACSRCAMGAAILTAQRRRCDARQLVVWDGVETKGIAGADADRRMWALSVGDNAARQTIIPVGDLSSAPKAAAKPTKAQEPRRMAALVFGDAKNFSKLSEDKLPLFVDRVMGGMASALAPAGDRLLFANTSGDGIFAVFDTAATDFALRLQEEMEALRAEMSAPDYPGPTLPAELKIRLGMHFGVVFEKAEHVTGARNYFGEAVVRAARIEPITKEGRISVSEEFAAEFALDPATNITANYVGETETAKNYGRFRLYRIKL